MNEENELNILAMEMRESIAIRNHRRWEMIHYKVYQKCFSGVDAAQWMRDKQKIEDNSIIEAKMKAMINSHIIVKLNENNSKFVSTRHSLYRFVVDDPQNEFHHGQVTIEIIIVLFLFLTPLFFIYILALVGREWECSECLGSSLFMDE